MEILSILRFLIILSVLVFVHELGHYLVARFFGIQVKEFGLGFPPRVFSKKYKGTIYSLNLLPIGGFVRLYGEDSSVEKDRGQAYYHKGKFVRAAVVTSGVIMNFLLAVLAFSIISWNIGIPAETGHVQLKNIASDSPAQTSGLKEGDIVKDVNGEAVSITKQFTDLINSKKGEVVKLSILRGEENLIIKITPRQNPPEGQGPIGVSVSSSELKQPPLLQRPFISLKVGFEETIFWIKLTIDSVATTIGQAITGHGAQGLSGPVGIYKITNQVASEGILALISLVGLLSVNLAVLNIMPFPALDGGRLFFIIVETVIRRRPNEKLEGYIHYGGMVLLLLFLLSVTFFNDLGGISSLKTLLHL